MRYRWLAWWFLILGTFTAVCILAAMPKAYAQSWTPPKYDCPFKSVNELRLARDDEKNMCAALWYCEKPNMISPNFLTGYCSNIPSFVLTLALEKINIGMQQKLSRPSTREEEIFVDELHEQQGVKIIVAALTGSTDRPIVKRLPNNTKGADTGKRIPIIGQDGLPTRCGWKRLQDSTGKPTMYFEVTGGYAICKVVGVYSK